MRVKTNQEFGVNLGLNGLKTFSGKLQAKSGPYQVGKRKSLSIHSPIHQMLLGGMGLHVHITNTVLFLILGRDTVHVSKSPWGEEGLWNRILAIPFNRQSTNIPTLHVDVKEYDNM